MYLLKYKAFSVCLDSAEKHLRLHFTFFFFFWRRAFHIFECETHGYSVEREKCFQQSYDFLVDLVHCSRDLFLIFSNKQYPNRPLVTYLGIIYSSHAGHMQLYLNI